MNAIAPVARPMPIATARPSPCGTLALVDRCPVCGRPHAHALTDELRSGATVTPPKPHCPREAAGPYAVTLGGAPS